MMTPRLVQIWTEAKGWVVVAVERDHDGAFDAAKQLEAKLGDVRLSIVDSKSGDYEWVNR